MMDMARSPVATRGKSSRRRLQRSIVGDVQLPIGAQARRPAILKVTIGHAEQIGHLAAACLVVDELARFQPIV